MWHYASKFGVASIEELSNDDFTYCLNRTDAYLNKKPELRFNWKIEEKKGPTTVEERSNIDKVNYSGTPKAIKY